MRVIEKTQIAAPDDEVWELLTSVRGADGWLGTGGHDEVVIGTPVRLRHRPGDAGTVTLIDATTHHLGIEFESGRKAVVEIEAAGAGKTVLRATEDDVPPAQESEVRSAWHVTLAAAWLLWLRAAEAREPRQAVLLIHGIGEQRPGATARSIADALFGPGRYLSKPDRVSGSYELRRLQLIRDKESNLPRTDIFELYWGHQIRDTKLSQVIRWLLGILRRPYRNVSSGMRGIWFLTRVALVLAILTVVLLAATIGADGLAALGSNVTAIAKLSYVSLAFTLASSAATGWLVHGLGDAARYLSSHPDNVAARTRIRDAALEVLRRVHTDHRYHRVVVAGHSLGSVVGYDSLMFYWSEVAAKHARPATPNNAPVAAYEKAAPSATGVDQQQLQYALWTGLRANGVPWLVTDFVTLGSPLAHAGTLIADGPDDARRLQQARVLATCPPEVDQKTGRYSYDQRYLSTEGVPSIRVLHHAALFGPTRWTNLYSPVRAGVLGDVVGGPVAPTFGAGVVDRAVTYSRALVRRTILAHTSYWRPDPAAGANGALALFQDALRLHEHASLAAIAHKRPLSDFLPSADDI